MATSSSFGNVKDAFQAAQTAQENGDLAAAAAIYRRIPEAFPHKKAAIGHAADGLMACGHWTEAVGLLETALARMPVSALILSRLAEIYRGIGDYGRAAQYLQRYLEHDPRPTEHWLSLAQLHAAAHNHAEAEAAFARVLAAEPANVTAALGHGDALHQRGRRDDAVAAYRRAHAAQPHNDAALFKLGSALMARGDTAEAGHYLRLAVTADPANARALVNLGLTHLAAGDLTEAAAAARQALAIDGTLQIAHLLLGTALAEQGDLDASADALRDAVSVAENVEALLLQSAVAAAREDGLLAERALQRVLAAAPESREARHLLAALHGEPLGAVAPGVCREAFDRIAPQYDNRHLHVRAYRAPADAVRLIEDAQPERRAVASVLDLGCGTGLALAALRDAFAVRSATGVDLSPGMIERAGAKTIYDRLIAGDAVETARRLPERFEVASAVDLFPYLGDLAPFFTMIGDRLAPGGLLAYSIETAGDRPFALARSGRFVHAPAYVEDLARGAGLAPCGAARVVLARDLGRPRHGVVGLLQRRD